MQEKRVTAQELFEPDAKYDELLRALAEKDNLIQQLTVQSQKTMTMMDEERMTVLLAQQRLQSQGGVGSGFTVPGFGSNPATSAAGMHGVSEGDNWLYRDVGGGIVGCE